MHQVGDIITVGLSPNTPIPADLQLAYVYRWWDQTVAVNATGTATKQINVGGNPADANLLRFTMEVCDQEGNSQKFGGSAQVNNPPSVVPSPSVTPNDQALPFNTQIKTMAYDLEEAGAIGFYWYQGNSPVPSGATFSVGPVPGTYAGTFVGSRTAYENTLNVNVTTAERLTLKIVDADSGTTKLDYELRGFTPAGPQFSVASQPNTLTSDATTLPTQVIAPGQTVNFQVHAFDSTPGSLSFFWSFYGSNGWSALDIPWFSTGTSQQAEQGVFNQVVRDISQETTAGLKTALVEVTNTSTGKSVQSSYQVQLTIDDPPVMESVGVTAPLTGLPLDNPVSVGQNPVILLSGTANDPDQDVVYYEWTLTQPVQPTTLVLYGHTVALDISQYPPGAYSLGTVRAVDRYGVASALFVIDQLTVVA